MKSPAIFYSPHQDDEALGMAGAIREHKEAGRPVYLVLLTNGINSGMLDIMNGGTYCSWHETSHNFNLTMERGKWNL
jgi:LmbE family N-acetylglucosaminyl deacetylase